MHETLLSAYHDTLWAYLYHHSLSGVLSDVFFILLVVCGGCLMRSLDHKPACPLCREPIHFSTEHPVNVTLSNIIESFFPRELAARKAEEEMISRQDETNMPLFVLNTIAVPGQNLPLHIFEPRYRLMMRRCMEGDKIFGLIGAHRDESGSWRMNEFGTVLKITDFKLLPDGRSYVNTIGTKVLFHTCSVMGLS